MSVVGNNRVGIPIVVLHDAEGAVVEIETKAGELIRGLLFEAEDQMNLYIKNAIIRDVNGVKRRSPQVYLRGTEIVFIILPDMLKHAPMFNRKIALFPQSLVSSFATAFEFVWVTALRIARIKHWRKHGGAPPEGVGQAVGQAAAIIRKAEDRRRGGFGGRFGGRGGGRDGGRGGGGGFGGRGGGRGDFGGRGGPPQRSFGQRPQGQYGP